MARRPAIIFCSPRSPSGRRSCSCCRASGLASPAPSRARDPLSARLGRRLVADGAKPCRPSCRNYVLPAYPALAILAALWLLAPSEDQPRTAPAGGAVCRYCGAAIPDRAWRRLSPRPFCCRSSMATAPWRLVGLCRSLARAVSGLAALIVLPDGRPADRAGRWRLLPLPDSGPTLTVGRRSRALTQLWVSRAAGRAGGKGSPARRSAAHAGRL